MSSPGCSSPCLFTDSQPTAVCLEWSLTDKLWVVQCFDFWQVITDKTGDRQQSEIIVSPRSKMFLNGATTSLSEFWLLRRWGGEGKSPSHKYHLPLGSPKEVVKDRYSPQKASSPQSSNCDTQIQNKPFSKQINKTGKGNCWSFFVIHGERKKNLLATADVTCKNHLTSPLGFMSSGRTLTSQTGRRFCLLNQPDFLGGSGCSARSTWETFGAPPDSAPSVGL